MSKADKMFEELGYTKNENIDKIKFTYKNKYNSIFTIEFSKTSKFYIPYKVTENSSWRQEENVDIELHLAIHEKMKELGWIE